MESFLRERTQRVSIGSVVSDEAILEHGIHGKHVSVFGPVTSHGLNTGNFADDSQLYTCCDSRTDYPVSQIEACLDEIRGWMRTNMLA